MDTSVSRRKLIDIKQPVFLLLSEEASERNISLKRLIEDKLDTAAMQYSVRKRERLNISPGIKKLIGSAKPSEKNLSDIDDERLQYILSK